MIGKKELAYLECDVCGRTYLWNGADPKEVLARARESGWECPPVNQTDRSGDICPRCRPPRDDAQILPELQPKAVAPADLPTDAIDMRRVMSRVLVEEVSPGLTAAEEIARVVVQGALAGDKGMIRILTDLGGDTHETKCPGPQED